VTFCQHSNQPIGFEEQTLSLGIDFRDKLWVWVGEDIVRTTFSARNVVPGSIKYVVLAQ